MQWRQSISGLSVDERMNQWGPQFYLWHLLMNELIMFNVDFLQTCVAPEKLEAKVLRREIVGLSAHHSYLFISFLLDSFHDYR